MNNTENTGKQQEEVMIEPLQIKKSEYSITPTKTEESAILPATPQLPPAVRKEPDIIKISGRIADALISKDRGKSDLTLYDSLDPETKQQITEQKITIDEINKQGTGVVLSAKQLKIVSAINDLLQIKKNNSIMLADNRPAVVMETNPLSTGGIPVYSVIVTPGEIAERINIGNYKISAGDRRDIVNTLQELADKKRLIIYQRKTYLPNGNTQLDKVEIIKPLIELAKYTTEIYDKDNKIILRTPQQFIITLNPVFFDQRNTYYLPNLTESLRLYGKTKKQKAQRANTNDTESNFILWLLKQQIGGKKETQPIEKNNLLETINPEYFRDKKGRLPLLEQQLQTAIEICCAAKMIKEFKKKNEKKTDKKTGKVYFYVYYKFLFF
jgi:hypothetical protein